MINQGYLDGKWWNDPSALGVGPKLASEWNLPGATVGHFGSLRGAWKGKEIFFPSSPIYTSTNAPVWTTMESRCVMKSCYLLCSSSQPATMRANSLPQAINWLWQSHFFQNNTKWMQAWKRIFIRFPTWSRCRKTTWRVIVDILGRQLIFWLMRFSRCKTWAFSCCSNIYGSVGNFKWKCGPDVSLSLILANRGR